jgi:hypothetical protein
MTEAEDRERKQFSQTVLDAVVQGFRAGLSREQVVAALVASLNDAMRQTMKGTADNGAGMDQATLVDMERMAGELYDAVLKDAEQEVLRQGDLRKAIFGGAVAATVGGLLWGFIATATNFVIGYMAVGLGMLAGGAVVIFSGRRGRPLQAVAVLASVLGIALGKYYIFGHVLRQMVGERYGAEIASRVSMLSWPTFRLFLESVPATFTEYDALWLALAIVAAWRIPKGFGLGQAIKNLQKAR